MTIRSEVEASYLVDQMIANGGVEQLVAAIARNSRATVIERVILLSAAAAIENLKAVGAEAKTVRSVGVLEDTVKKRMIEVGE